MIVIKANFTITDAGGIHKLEALFTCLAVGGLSLALGAANEAVIAVVVSRVAVSSYRTGIHTGIVREQ